jgi:hypothetical protein
VCSVGCGERCKICGRRQWGRPGIGVRRRSSGAAATKMLFLGRVTNTEISDDTLAEIDLAHRQHGGDALGRGCTLRRHSHCAGGPPWSARCP